MTISELIEKFQEVGDQNGYDQEVCITWILLFSVANKKI